MKNGMMGAWGLGRFVVALGTLSLGLLVTGCEPECLDRFDCANKGNPGEDKQYACVASRCVAQDIPSVTDAGTDPCANVQHDPKLGTLRLQTGFTAAAETATLPEGIGAVTAVPSGAEFKLYGLRNTDLYALGTWPNVALGAAPLQSIIAEPDRARTTFSSGYLTNDGTRLLAGYTKQGPVTNIPGTALVYDTVTPANSKYLSANGNFSAAGFEGGFLINGQGIEGSNESGNAIYALKTSTSSFQGSKLASFPPVGLYSGFTAMATNGVAVLGFSDNNFANHVRAVAPATYTPALTSGTPFTLSDTNAPEVYSGADLQSVAGFGEGVALHRGTFTTTSDISRFELTLGGITPTSVTVGALQSVLTTSNTCTNVVLLAPMGPDLLVGVKDKNGRRLVRLQVAP
ncbi:hypothetical protein [Archangium sp.]|uniref:hypothetical protein n=1 Tax=Archangium sp. TaxID=1872627 RepID=UPI00286B0C5B|nr:hypothetical protein [Archangium sp.]